MKIKSTPKGFQITLDIILSTENKKMLKAICKNIDKSENQFFKDQLFKYKQGTYGDHQLTNFVLHIGHSMSQTIERYYNSQEESA